MGSSVDIRELVPTTRPRSPMIERTTEARLAAGHHVLQYREIARGRFTNVNVDAEYLALISHYPVAVFVDGAPVVADEDHPRQPDVGLTSGPNNFALAIEAADGLNCLFRPAMSFTIRRRMTSLSILATGNTTDYDGCDVPGSLHLFLGAGGVEDLGFGLPIPHTFDIVYAGAAVATLSTDVQPTLHGNNAASPAGFKWIPVKSELIGISIAGITWAGAAGVISEVYLTMTTGGGFFDLVRYRPNLAAVDFDFGVPMEFPNYNSRRVALDNRGRPALVIVATQTFTALTATLRWRSFM